MQDASASFRAADTMHERLCTPESCRPIHHTRRVATWFVHGDRNTSSEMRNRVKARFSWQILNTPLLDVDARERNACQKWMPNPDTLHHLTKGFAEGN